MIPGDLLSAFPHRQFHTLPGLLDSRVALPNSYPNACVPCREAVCTIFMMVFGMTLRTHDLPCETTYTLPTEPTRHGRSQKSLGFSDVVLKHKFTMKCYEAVLYTKQKLSRRRSGSQSGLRFGSRSRCTRLQCRFIVQYNKTHHNVVHCSVIEVV